jgi:hypothetical protein
MSKKYKCRNCKSTKIFNLINFNKVPLANNLVLSPKTKVSKYELRLILCRNCYLVQTTKNIDKKKIFNSSYPYLTSISSIANKNAYELSRYIKKKFDLKNKTLFELASNDGYFLKNFLKTKKLNIIGIEPTPIPAKISKARGIKTIKKFFGKNLAKNLKIQYKAADLIVANNVIAHLSNIHDFVKGMKILLNKNGTIIIEFQNFIEMVNKNLIDNVYHEHYFYYTLTSIQNLLNRNGLKIYDAKNINVHGGSLRIFACHESDNLKETDNFKKMYKIELKNSKNINFYKKFQKNFFLLKKNIFKFLRENSSKKILGFGAAAKASTFINLFNIHKYNIKKIIDNAKSKQQKYIAGTNIKVVHPKDVRISDYDFIFIFAWNLKKEIFEFIKNYYLKKNISAVTFIPKIKITKL